MSYEVIAITVFTKKLKKLLRIYPDLKFTLTELIKSLELNPKQGISLGNSYYKIRIALPGKNKGKSGGARVITNIKLTKSRVYLVNIYDKSETNNITKEQLDKLFNDIPFN